MHKLIPHSSMHSIFFSLSPHPQHVERMVVRELSTSSIHICIILRYPQSRRMRLWFPVTSFAAPHITVHSFLFVWYWFIFCFRSPLLFFFLFFFFLFQTATSMSFLNCIFGGTFHISGNRMSFKHSLNFANVEENMHNRDCYSKWSCTNSVECACIYRAWSKCLKIEFFVFIDRFYFRFLYVFIISSKNT